MWPQRTCSLIILCRMYRLRSGKLCIYDGGAKAKPSVLKLCLFALPCDGHRTYY